MRRKLSNHEIEQIREERLRRERETFPDIDIEVIVEEMTYGNGEPVVRVVRAKPQEK